MTFIIVPILPSSIKSCRTTRSTKIFTSSCARKPRGYWHDEGNLSRELQLFSDTNGLTTSSMPTAAELLAAGRIDLCRAVQRNGGFAGTARKVGRTAVRRQRGYWQTSLHGHFTTFNTTFEFQRIRQEIFQLMQQGKIQHGIMPSISLLKSLQRTDLITSIIALGGFLTVGSKLGLVSARWKKSFISSVKKDTSDEVKNLQTQKKERKPVHYWNNWHTFRQELNEFAEKYCDGHMPLQRELIDNDRSDLLNAIQRHGGMTSVSRKASLIPSSSKRRKRPRGYWNDPSVLRAELLTFTAKHGHPGLMPRRDQLLKAGRTDLVYAISKYGGYSTIATDLHLIWYGPSSYWRVFRNLRKRLISFAKQRSGGSIMPSVQDLKQCGRMDLMYGIALHGGVMKVARRIGLQVSYPKRSSEFWDHPKNIQRELEDILKVQPLENRRFMPTSVALIQAGRADLATAIRDRGGWVYYAQRLGLRFNFEVRPYGFWRKESDVLRELKNYVNGRYGSWEHPGQQSDTSLKKGRFFPSTEMLKRDGRSDIAYAIERYHGGMDTFAMKNGLTIAEDTVKVQPVEELSKWKIFVKEITKWMNCYGVDSIMPTRQDFIRTGRYDLRRATYKHGGTKVISKRLQLVSMESLPQTWLAGWLAMQAARMSQTISMKERNKLTETGERLLEKMEKRLDGSALLRRVPVGKIKIGQVHKGRVEAKRRRRYRTGVKGSRCKSISNSTLHRNFRSEFSREDLDRIRGKYKHLPDNKMSVL